MRKLKNWIDSYLIFTKGQESPEVFKRWSAIWALSVVLGRKVYVDRTFFKLYPNFYIILVAESAAEFKSTSLRIAKSLFNELTPDKPFILPEEITPASMIDQVVRFRDKNVLNCSYYPKDEKLRPVSYFNMYSSELRRFLGEKDANPKLISLMTDLYDCDDSCNKGTIYRGLEYCVNVYATLGSATVLSWLKSCLSKDQMTGGFANRVTWVLSSDRAEPIAHPFISDESKNIRIDLIHDLHKIRSIDGEYKWSKEAWKWYKGWYNNYRTVIIPEAPIFLEHYLGRRHTNLIKLSMILTAARTDSLLIELEDFELADDMLKNTEIGLSELFDEMMLQSEDDRRVRKFVSVLRVATNSRARGIKENDLLRELMGLGVVSDNSRFQQILNALLIAGLAERFVHLKMTLIRITKLALFTYGSGKGRPSKKDKKDEKELIEKIDEIKPVKEDQDPEGPQ